MSVVPGVARRSVVVHGAAIGVAVTAGALYTLSPMAGWLIVWMAIVFRWAVAGTAAIERRWVLAALGLAVGLRVVAIAVLPFLVDPIQHQYATYSGDALYAIQRSIWIRNVFVGVPIAARDYIEAFEPLFGWSGYNYMLAYLHVLFGPSPYGIALFSTGLFLTASVMLFRQCRRGFGALAAFVTLVVMLFMPSWFAWSVAPLKEAISFLLLTAIVSATAALLRGAWPMRVGAVAVMAVAIVVSGTLRNGGTAFAVLGAGLPVALWLVTRRWWIAVAVVAALPLVAVQLSRNPVVSDVAVANVNLAAARHLGHTRTVGFSYRLLDDKFYVDPRLAPSDQVFGLTFDESVRFLIRSVVAFFVVPTPWDLPSAFWLIIVPQQTVWYMLVCLAVCGVASGLRRAAPLTFALSGIVVAVVIVIAPNSGNVGTLIRHRDVAVPFVSALAGMGAVTVATRLGKRGRA